MPQELEMQGPNFSAGFYAEFEQLLVWRRDVRAFKTDVLPDGTFERLVGLASLAPSVGLSQPWRFVLVDDGARRKAIRENFSRSNRAALEMEEGERAALYANLKLAGLEKAPLQFAIFVDSETEQGHRLGRRSMPETVTYSSVIALHTIWLAARIDGIGLGWVSILDPIEATKTLDVPEGWRFLGYFCLGYPEISDDQPALQRAGWEERHDPANFILYR